MKSREISQSFKYDLLADSMLNKPTGSFHYILLKVVKNWPLVQNSKNIIVKFETSYLLIG
jgi:hypothetical protein